MSSSSSTPWWQAHLEGANAFARKMDRYQRKGDDGYAFQEALEWSMQTDTLITIDIDDQRRYWREMYQEYFLQQLGRELVDRKDRHAVDACAVVDYTRMDGGDDAAFDIAEWIQQMCTVYDSATDAARFWIVHWLGWRMASHATLLQSCVDVLETEGYLGEGPTRRRDAREDSVFREAHRVFRGLLEAKERGAWTQSDVQGMMESRHRTPSVLSNLIGQFASSGITPQKPTKVAFAQERAARIRAMAAMTDVEQLKRSLKRELDLLEGLTEEQGAAKRVKLER